MTVELQPAYILHTRPYRDTSMLIDFFTPGYGRVTAVARGVRSRKAPKRNLLNPFTRLLISFQGKTDLKLLTHFEAEGDHFTLVAKHLFSGFYLNELLVRLLPELDACPEIYELYEHALRELSEGLDLEPILRRFEFRLLNELGYGVSFFMDVHSTEMIQRHLNYFLDPLRGFYVVDYEASNEAQFCGDDILAIYHDDYCLPEVRQTAKRISRMLLKPILGSKPLASRELFN